MVSGGNDVVLRVWRESGRAGTNSGFAENAMGDDAVRLKASGGCDYDIISEATMSATISQVAVSQVREMAGEGGDGRREWRRWVRKLVAH